jgi:hypothetical protein
MWDGLGLGGSGGCLDGGAAKYLELVPTVAYVSVYISTRHYWGV